LRRLIAQPLPAVAAVVTGRFGGAPTLKMEQPDLPFLRFLEQPRVYYPGVELVGDAELSGDTDPYLADHVFQGERLFPAVMGLEAMAQAAMALMETVEPPTFAEVQFSRPVVIPEGTSVTIRVAALVRGPDQVEVVLRSEETAFQVDHFRATCRFGLRSSKFQVPSFKFQVPELVAGKLPPVAIAPELDLYGSLLFHKGRFQRLRGYRWLTATECVAEVAPDNATIWFGRYLPSTLVLGDPGARDAAIHAIQACIPHTTLLPIGVNRFVPGVASAPGPWFVHARERAREKDTFTYDVEVLRADGYVQERWEGLQLRRVSNTTPQAVWVEPLLGPYIEHRVPELIPGATVAVMVERDAGAERRARSDRAMQRALGETVPVWRRPDGKPEVTDSRAVCAAHVGDLTLAVAGSRPVGCDVEPVSARPTAVWQDLLGQERFTLAAVVSQETSEDQDTAATRVWAASECLKKAGAVGNAPLMLTSATADGWVQLAAGPLVTATYTTSVRGGDNRLVLAVLVRNGDARL
jgi:enediyne polyketide synthase